jgi:hypothetical protein
MGTLTRAFSCIILGGTLIGTYAYAGTDINLNHGEHSMQTLGANPSQHEMAVVDGGWQTRRARTLRDFNVAFGEITVFCGPDNRSNAVAGFRKAVEMIDRGEFRKALVINTVTSTRWVLEEGRTVAPGRVGQRPHEHDVVVCTSDIGRLWDSVGDVRELVERHGFDILIVNSWEMASFDSRMRDRLIFGLRGLVEDYGITILVYSGCHVRETGPAGVTKRSSLGRLSVTAARIVDIRADEEMIEAMREQAGEPRTMRPMTAVEHLAEVQAAEREGKALPEPSERFVMRESKLHLHEIAEMTAKLPVEVAPEPERRRELVAETAMAA